MVMLSIIFKNSVNVLIACILSNNLPVAAAVCFLAGLVIAKEKGVMAHAGLCREHLGADPEHA